jgi:hypothetical protein
MLVPRYEVGPKDTGPPFPYLGVFAFAPRCEQSAKHSPRAVGFTHSGQSGFLGGESLLWVQTHDQKVDLNLKCPKYAVRKK